jgi:DNA-binding PadR family transcriptional regulator
VSATWEVLGDQKRECKYYRLTAAGRKQLRAEESNWNHMAEAIARVMRTAPGKA